MISERGKIFFLVTVVGLVLFGALRNDILHKLLLVENISCKQKLNILQYIFKLKYYYIIYNQRLKKSAK